MNLSAISNPFFAPSQLPYELPDFSLIKAEHYLEAIKAGVQEAKSVFGEIANFAKDSASNPPAATFENTILPLDRPSAILDRAQTAFYNVLSADATDDLLKIEAEITPILTDLNNELWLNPDIFARVKSVYDNRGDHAYSPEELALIEHFHRSFSLAGAALSDDERKTLAQLNLKLAELETNFANQVTNDLNNAAVLITDENELAGLSADQIEAAQLAAKEAGVAGWLLTLILPTMQPLLSVLKNREVRERLYLASVNRGDEHKNWALAAEIAALRQQKAALLGFSDFASLTVANRAAKESKQVDELFSQFVAPAVANAHKEAEKIRLAAQQDGIAKLEPWDWAYYSERVKEELYAVDSTALRPYFELDRTLEDGVFYAANLVYGITFKRRDDLAGYHPQNRVWEVFNADSSSIGLFVGDFFTRSTKRGGAWMNNLVKQSLKLNLKPVVVNNLNISAPAKGAPALLTLDEVSTLFHEFGHALHGLFSQTEYLTLSGTSVEQDIVEYPSQVNEMWMLHPQVLENYARHVETGEVVPRELIEKVLSSAKWGEGFATVEFLMAGLLDWAWHRLPADLNAEAVFDPKAFETKVLKDAGLDFPLIAPRYRTSYFNHTFSGNYASSYYSYLWADVFAANTEAWYREATSSSAANWQETIRAKGDRFRQFILTFGGVKNLTKQYELMTGSKTKIEPLLQKRGLLD